MLTVVAVEETGRVCETSDTTVCEIMVATAVEEIGDDWRRGDYTHVKRGLPMGGQERSVNGGKGANGRQGADNEGEQQLGRGPCRQAGGRF